MEEQEKQKYEEECSENEVVDTETQAETEEKKTSDQADVCCAHEELIAKLKDEVARGRADYFNLRTRMERDRESNIKLASEKAVKEMLPVFENLERIAAAIDDKESALAKGISMVVKQFETGLANLGLEFIPADGTFDPSLHEAVFMDPVEDEAMDGKITGMISRGYKLAGRVLKASQVKVGKYNG
ncbi:MAG: nucleotide exchange factor GrpE [Synergistes sp.]|nr:nucleotide exchange factor GrpE [Synergistes sp.]